MFAKECNNRLVTAPHASSPLNTRSFVESIKRISIHKELFALAATLSSSGMNA
jgi:hypothetical protein